MQEMNETSPAPALPLRHPRWSASTWVLACLGLVIVLITGDVLRQKFAPPPPKPAAPRPKPQPPAFKVGDEVKDFELPDSSGKPHGLSEWKGQKFVLTFFCGCDVCGTFSKELTRAYRENKRDVPTFSVFTSGFDPVGEAGWVLRTDAKQFTYVYAIQNPQIVEEYQGHPCPKAYVVDENLKILYVSPKASTSMGPMGPALMVRDICKVLGLKHKMPHLGPPAMNHASLAP